MHKWTEENDDRWFLDTLSNWMTIQEKELLSLPELSEEVSQIGLETDFLLQASNQLESAYSSILGKMNHENS